MGAGGAILTGAVGCCGSVTALTLALITVGDISINPTNNAPRRDVIIFDFTKLLFVIIPYNTNQVNKSRSPGSRDQDTCFG